MRQRPLILALLASLALAATAAAQTTAQSFPPSQSGLPIPRFVSLKGEPVNLRAGPGVRYPVRWVYVRKHLPLMVTGEFEYWRRVRDPDGTEGWIHKSLLRGERTAMVLGGLAELRAEPKADAPVAARAEPGVIADLTACVGAWCRLESEGAAGWVPRGAIYGALPEEDFER